MGLVAIENMISQAREYTNNWLNFQWLFDWQHENFNLKIGQTLDEREKFLEKMDESRKLFDTIETQRAFGPAITIDYEQVQTIVNEKYEEMYKEVLKEVSSSLLGKELHELHTKVGILITSLESKSVEASSTSKAGQLLEYVQLMTEILNGWRKIVNVYMDAEKILKRNQPHFYKYPTNWIETNYIQNELNDFNKILKSKEDCTQIQIATLQSKIL